MFKILRKWWKYLAVRLDMLHGEHADPKILLQQAIDEARDQHRRLIEQAAAVIAHQRQAQQRRDRLVADHQKAQASLVNALRLVDEHQRGGMPTEVARLSTAAEAVASRLIALEQDIERSEAELIDAARAAESAKQAVAQNGSRLQARLADRERLLSDLDRAKMQERLNSAMRQVSLTVGQDVPTLEEVRHTIDVRMARAEGMRDLLELESATSGATEMWAFEQSLQQIEAQRRIAGLRSQLGLPAAPDTGVRSLTERTVHDDQP